MRRMLVSAIAGAALAVMAAGTAGCARGTADGVPPVGKAPAGHRPAKVEAIYVQVLRRYLTTPAENSFPGRTFRTVYVLDRAFPDAADPTGKHQRGTLIAPSTQHQITAALAGLAHIAFIANRYTVIEPGHGCGQVRGGGILITLGPPNGDDHNVHVAINGYVACLGATWLTYIVQNHPGTGWRVTGTTGHLAIS